MHLLNYLLSRRGAAVKKFVDSGGTWFRESVLGFWNLQTTAEERDSLYVNN